MVRDRENPIAGLSFEAAKAASGKKEVKVMMG